MVKIAIDGTPISTQGKGLSRFLLQLVNAFAYHGNQLEIIVYLNSRNPIPKLPNVAHIRYIKIRIVNSLLWDLFQFPLVLRHQPVDLVFSCSDRLPLLYGGRILLYLFELPTVRHKLAWNNASLYAKFSMKLTDALFPISARRAVRILTSSIATKESLCYALTSVQDRIDVIYPGRDEDFTPPVDEEARKEIMRRLSTPERYVLHFSSIGDPRDNTEVALRAFGRSVAKLPSGTQLLVAGKTNPDVQGLSAIVHELGLENRVVWAGYIQEEVLADIYRCAEVYFDPSLYEGFGYQVIEAMSCGTPVICSNTTSFPEIVGEAAITANPSDTDAFASALIKVLNSPDLRAQMRVKGLRQAAHFSWSDSGAKLVRSIEQIVCE